MCTLERVKLATWARSYGVHPQTAYRWFRNGTMPVPARRLASGTIVVELDTASGPAGRTVAYCRVSALGVEHLAAALSAQGRAILVVDEGEVDDDLVRDMTEVLTSFCARLYGRRGARNRALRAMTTAKSSDAA